MTRRIPIEELIELLGIDERELRSLREEGLFEEELLEVVAAEELRVAACLMKDLGVNAAGVEVILHMRRRMLLLQGRTRDSLRRLLDELEPR